MIENTDSHWVTSKYPLISEPPYTLPKPLPVALLHSSHRRFLVEVANKAQSVAIRGSRRIPREEELSSSISRLKAINAKALRSNHKTSFVKCLRLWRYYTLISCGIRVVKEQEVEAFQKGQKGQKD